ncbi:putative T7SS-secreted protein [Streptomyces sp. NPDC050400]|uniref:putative T7SS-secreted protein n=1 Tax=Streptomyces sp. NPDC050400 TaxID=3365610 RepID=UPI0037B19999
MGVLGDIKDGINGGLKAGGHLLDEGKKKLGEGVDYVSDKAGDYLDKAGLDKAGDLVHNVGDHIAAGLGATPTEQGLGHTDDPTQLIHGNPGHIRESAKHLKDFYTAFDHVGQGMKKVRSSGWTGEAADVFHRKFEMHPTKWLQAADACQDAARALDAYADAIKWAQDKAQDAIDKYKKAQHASKTAIDAYNKKIDAYNAKVNANEDPGPEPDPFHDPGHAGRKDAENILADARRSRNEAADTANAAIKAALAHAPAEPPPLSQIKGNLGDVFTAADIERTHLLGGVVKGTAGLLNFARGLNPSDPYNLTHPAEYYQNVNTTLAGLVSTGTHPERIITAAVDGFKKDPSEFVGRLLPELVGTKGAGLARGGMRMAMKEGTEVAATTAARKGLNVGEEVGSSPKLPDSWKIEPPAPPKDWSDLAQSTDHVQAKAIHYDSVNPQKAQEFLDSEYPWLKDVNNTGHPGYTDNCSHNVVSVDRRLDGAEVSASPKKEGDHIPPEQLGLPNRAKGHYDPVDSYDDLVRDLESRGEGSRSAVYISRPDGTAHVFNAVNTPHGVVFLDGQSGTLGRLEQDVSSIMHIPYRDGLQVPYSNASPKW